MSKAEQFLNSYKQNAPQYKVDTSGYIDKNNQAMGGLQSSREEIFSNYKQQGQGYLDNLKQQTQTRMQMLNQQLANNKQKYALQGKEQADSINKQYKQQNDEIDAMTFEQYKMSNQMGANRGMSASAQQQAMDNHVGQQSAGLFNQNSTNRNDSLNSLYNKMMQGMIDLDNQYMQSATDVYLNQMDKEGQYNLNMSQQEMQYATETAKMLVEQQLKNNEIEFANEKEKAQYEAQMAQQIASMYFSTYTNQDNQAFQTSEREASQAFQKAMQEAQFANQMKMAQFNASQNKGSSEADAMLGDMYQYYLNKGYSPLEAEKRAKQDMANIKYNVTPEQTDSTKYAGYSTADRSGATSYQKSNTSTSTAKQSNSILDMFKKKDSKTSNVKGMSQQDATALAIQQRLYQEEQARAEQLSKQLGKPVTFGRR